MKSIVRIHRLVFVVLIGLSGCRKDDGGDSAGRGGTAATIDSGSSSMDGSQITVDAGEEAGSGGTSGVDGADTPGGSGGSASDAAIPDGGVPDGASGDGGTVERCRELGTSCSRSGCGFGLVCVSAICLPSDIKGCGRVAGSYCDDEPGTECLVYRGTDSGVCLTAADLDCVCTIDKIALTSFVCTIRPSRDI